MFGIGKRKTIEDMLAALAPLNIGLAPGRTVVDLTSDWSRDQIEKDGYEMMLAALGSEMLDGKTFESKGWISNDVWHFDGECIEAEDAYTPIINRAVMISGGELKLDSIRSFVDFDAGAARVEWISRNKPARHDLKFDNDWADSALFEILDAELAAQGSTRQFFNVPLGQDCIFICCEPARRSALQKTTGLTLRKLV